ncbi:MAG: phosphoenolpyruvate--protein phosphotransferase [Endomicrobiales bacterium]
MATRKPLSGKMRIYRGEGIAPGVALGTAFISGELAPRVPQRETVGRGKLPEEKARLLKACDDASEETRRLVEKVRAEIGAGESVIFQAHLLILKDKNFVGEMVRRLEEESLSAESAVQLVVDDWEKTFSSSPSPQLQMKVFDIIDIGKRILSKLSLSHAFPRFPSGRKAANTILAGKMLLPSHTAIIDRNNVTGIVAELGSKVSHAAVIARSLGLPSVFGVPNVIRNIKNNDELIVDGSSGIVYVNPDDEVKKEYESFKKRYHGYMKQLDRLTALPSVTLDGREIGLYANVGACADAELAVKYRARGVGLYRTEMPFIIRNEFPAEDVQYAIYRKVFERMRGRPVSVRMLDLGGDKMASFLPVPKEENPNLGWRAIRVFIDHPHFFKTQIRAVLRAAVGADARIILPMISDLTEVRITKRIFAEAKRELAAKKVPFNDRVPVGIMVEVPSAVILASSLIQEVDFFSVGTNDLIQYTLAVDRNSEKAARYFEPLNPAVVYMMKRLVDVARAAGKDITVCGEVASDPLYIPLLVGLGYDKLSVSPLAVNMVKDIVRSIDAKEAEKLASVVLEKRTAREIRTLMEGYIRGLKTRFSLTLTRPAPGFRA